LGDRARMEEQVVGWLGAWPAIHVSLSIFSVSCLVTGLEGSELLCTVVYVVSLWQLAGDSWLTEHGLVGTFWEVMVLV